MRLNNSLSTVPCPDDPDCTPLDAVEEAVRAHYDLTVGKVGELRKPPPRLGILRNSLESVRNSIAKALRSR